MVDSAMAGLHSCHRNASSHELARTSEITKSKKTTFGIMVLGLVGFVVFDAASEHQLRMCMSSGKPQRFAVRFAGRLRQRLRFVHAHQKMHCRAAL